jgi:hypothetical protein
MITMLSSAMTGYMSTLDAIRLVLFDTHILFESLGWTIPGWQACVRAFPLVATGNAVVDSSSDSEAISDEDWIRALKHLEDGGTITELVTKLHFTVNKSERIGKKYGELKSFDARTHTHTSGSEEKDEEELKLEREVRMAELQRKRAEQLRPLEVDKILTDIRATLDEPGSWRQGHCSHMANNYCMYWRWKERLHSPYQIGEPLLKDGSWFIRPTNIRCAVCSAYHEIDTASLQSIELRLSAIMPVTTIFDTVGPFKRQRCNHLQNKHCTYWGWNQRPDDAVTAGSLLYENSFWHIQPTNIYCTLCQAYSEKGKTDIQTLGASVSDIQRRLDATPMIDLKSKFTCPNCGSKDSVAANIKCTKCGNEDWWGWHPSG